MTASELEAAELGSKLETTTRKFLEMFGDNANMASALVSGKILRENLNGDVKRIISVLEKFGRNLKGYKQQNDKVLPTFDRVKSWQALLNRISDMLNELEKRVNSSAIVRKRVKVSWHSYDQMLHMDTPTLMALHHELLQSENTFANLSLMCAYQQGLVFCAMKAKFEKKEHGTWENFCSGVLASNVVTVSRKMALAYIVKNLPKLLDVDVTASCVYNFLKEFKKGIKDMLDNLQGKEPTSLAASKSDSTIAVFKRLREQNLGTQYEIQVADVQPISPEEMDCKLPEQDVDDKYLQPKGVSTDMYPLYDDWALKQPKLAQAAGGQFKIFHDLSSQKDAFITVQKNKELVVQQILAFRRLQDQQQEWLASQALMDKRTQEFKDGKKAFQERVEAMPLLLASIKENWQAIEKCLETARKQFERNQRKRKSEPQPAAATSTAAAAATSTYRLTEEQEAAEREEMKRQLVEAELKDQEVNDMAQELSENMRIAAEQDEEDMRIVRLIRAGEMEWSEISAEDTPRLRKADNKLPQL